MRFIEEISVFWVSDWLEVYIQYFYCYIHPGLGVLNPNFWIVAEICRICHPRRVVLWWVVLSSTWGCNLCRRLKSLSVECWVASSVSSPLKCRTGDDASYRVCWSVTVSHPTVSHFPVVRIRSRLEDCLESVVSVGCTRKFLFISI